EVEVDDDVEELVDVDDEVEELVELDEDDDELDVLDDVDEDELVLELVELDDDEDEELELDELVLDDVEEDVDELVDVDVVVVGHGSGEQVPVPKSVPPSVAHWVALSTMHVNAPIAEPGTQHWTGATVVDVVLVVLVTLDVDVELVVDDVPN